MNKLKGFYINESYERICRSMYSISDDGIVGLLHSLIAREWDFGNLWSSLSQSNNELL